MCLWECQWVTVPRYSFLPVTLCFAGRPGESEHVSLGVSMGDSTPIFIPACDLVVFCRQAWRVCEGVSLGGVNG